MKKLKFNSTLNHKQSDYKPYEVEVEKVITLYGRQFDEMKEFVLNDNPWIKEYSDLMYIDSNDVAHCLLFIDNETGDGILVEAEGCGYARKSQFIPNARALLESNELTAAEIKLHERLKDIADKIAELAAFLLKPVSSFILKMAVGCGIMYEIGQTNISGVVN